MFKQNASYDPCYAQMFRGRPKRWVLPINPQKSSVSTYPKPGIKTFYVTNKEKTSKTNARNSSSFSMKKSFDNLEDTTSRDITSESGETTGKVAEVRNCQKTNACKIGIQREREDEGIRLNCNGYLNEDLENSACGDTNSMFELETQHHHKNAGNGSTKTFNIGKAQTDQSETPTIANGNCNQKSSNVKCIRTTGNTKRINSPSAPENLTSLEGTSSRSYWTSKSTVFVEPELLVDIGCEVSVSKKEPFHLHLLITAGFIQRGVRKDLILTVICKNMHIY